MAIAPDEAAFSQPPDIEVLDGIAALPEPSHAPGGRRHAFVYEQRGIGRFLCDRGRRIVATRFAQAGEVEFLRALIATALPAALWMRDELALHAAAAVFPRSGRAIAIAGPSGSGKSTILAQLVALDARVVGDDTICARVVDGSVQASGLPAACLLRPDSAVQDREREIRRVPEAQQLPSAGVGTILVLDHPRRAGTPGFRRLTGTAALEAMLGIRHRPWIPRLLGSEGAMLPKIVQLLQRVEVYSWTRPEGGQALDARELRFLLDLG